MQAEVLALEWVIGIAIAALLAGAGLGYLIAARTGNRAKVTELETALDQASNELKDYKREVLGQFAETAEKFHALDRSYQDLHRQLAASSVALCGDAGSPLLEGPPAQVLQDKQAGADAAEDEILVSEAVTEHDEQPRPKDEAADAGDRYDRARA